MRQHVQSAARRRDERLAHVRKLSLWITGGAAFASIGLGAAFAQALPGHTAGTSSSSAHATTPGSGAPAGTGATSSSSPAPAAGGHHGRHHRHRLTAPAQAPAQPTHSAAPPVVTSGGS